MAGAVNLTEVDFQQIKENLVDYLKSTNKFTDFDFDGSNLSVILNLIAYQAQLNAYTTNMVANESFLATSTIRKNVVANARQIGYTPVSTKSAQSNINFTFNLTDLGGLAEKYPGGLPQSLNLEPGFAFSAKSSEFSVNFNIIDPVSAAISSNGECEFINVPIYEGTLLEAKFTVDKSDFNQRFIIENDKIDTSTMRVEVQEDSNVEKNEFYNLARNLTEVNENSRVYWIEEVEANRYEITFGDGMFGKALADGAVIQIRYLRSSGESGNGASNINTFVHVGRVYDSFGTSLNLRPVVTAVSASAGGAEIESISSIKLRAPKSYGSQNRCVTPQDYENLIREIYPGVDDIYVYGGETKDIPEYGRVYVVIKPNNSDYLPVSTKHYIKKSLDNYRIASLDIILEDPDVLHIEAETQVFFDDKKTNKDASSIATTVSSSLEEFSKSSIVSRFGGSVRYSRIVGVVDDSDESITRNSTILRMRKDVTVVENTAASYEVCFENPLKIDYDTNIFWTTGFNVSTQDRGDSDFVYMRNKPPALGQTTSIIQMIKFDEFGKEVVFKDDVGTIDFTTGEIMIGYDEPISITNTELPSSVVEMRAYGVDSGKDIIATKTVYLDFDVSKSIIGATVDTEITGS